MTSVTLKELGYLSPSQIDKKHLSIQKMADMGLHLFPCHSATQNGCGCLGKRPHKDRKEWGKHPSQNTSHLLATRASETLRQWWTNSPEDNVGCHLKISKKVVIDIDPRSGGHVSWCRLLADLSISEPVTWKTWTGTYVMEDGSVLRGFHLWFEMPVEKNFPANLKEIGYEGIDIKYSGYVMIPPSRHGSGVEYEWAQGQEAEKSEIASMPQSLLNKILSGQKNKERVIYVGFALPPRNAASTVAKLLDTHIYEGARNVGFYQLSCKVAYWLGCYSEAQAAQVEQEMLRFNESHVHPPLAESDNPSGQIQRAIDFVRQGGSSNA